MLILLSNPSCGAGTGHQFVESHVLPFLEKHNLKPDVSIVTNDVVGARAQLLERVRRAKDSEDVRIVLSGGDGTVHEVVNTLCTASTARGVLDHKQVKIALVPAGTANALYASYFPPSEGEDTAKPEYKLQSVQRLVNGHTLPSPLTIARTALYGPTSTDSPTQSILSTVVTSTALHASILHDSEALRKEIPGMERFKVAAGMNATRWYNATVVFKPSADGVLMRYDIAADKFVDVGSNNKMQGLGPPDNTDHNTLTPTGAENNSNRLELNGPFVYLLSTVNVDRLEPAFEIAPLQRKLPPANKRDSMDVVVIQPCKARSRDSAIKHQSPVPSAEGSIDSGAGDGGDDGNVAKAGSTTPEAFAEVTMTALMAAYQHGAHVALKYDADGKVSSGGDGASVVDYIRCGGWEWTPEGSDESAGLVCSDGTILRIEKGGKAECTVSSDEMHFYIYG